MDFFVFILLCSPISFFSQVNHLDSLKEAMNTPPKFLMKLDSKFSFVSNQLVTMNGVKAGLNFKSKIKLGLGYSWMKNNFTFDNPNAIVNNENYDLRYSYVSVFGDYNFYKKNKWSYLLNTDLAIVKLGYKNRQTKQFDYQSFGSVLEPSLIGEYNLIKYLVIGSGIGYRFVFRESNNITEKFSAPIVILRLKVDFVKIYKEEVLNK
ncbi:MAG: hypothetical protein N4A35_15070 [Flavobacteriales bacterium]|jgi:hypothetical protein|nr:hypothetical protein [Flavobacteriales bacterium]